MNEASKCARIVTWAGGTHTFDLSHPYVWNVLSIRGLPGPNGATPVACLARFDSGTYSLDDVERVLELGLIGGGGSILTVPVLVYIFSMDASAATVYSLFIVGLTSAVGSVNYFKRSLINIKTALLFGIPSIAGVFLTRIYIVPAIPEHIFNIGIFAVTKHVLLLLLFAVLMIAASYSMIKKTNTVNNDISSAYFNYPLIMLQGFAVGVITGLVGAGGGFMIIPALIFMLKLPMKEAIGTSLVIIAANSLLGFLSSVNHFDIHWPFLLTIAAFAIVGIFIGTRLSKNIDGAKLKPAFGWFVLAMGIYIVVKETIIQ